VEACLPFPSTPKTTDCFTSFLFEACPFMMLLLVLKFDTLPLHHSTTLYYAARHLTPIDSKANQSLLLYYAPFQPPPNLGQLRFQSRDVFVLFLDPLLFSIKDTRNTTLYLQGNIRHCRGNDRKEVLVTIFGN
jgi:hypothetical protein